MLEILSALEDTGLAQHLRLSRWTYPIVNVVHVLGLAALFGAVLTLDLRLLARGSAPEAGSLSGIAVTVAAAGLVVAFASGFLLFSARATEYAAMPAFWTKIALVGLATANAAAARLGGLEGTRPRTVGAVSLVGWTGAIAAGRLIGYFEG